MRSFIRGSTVNFRATCKSDDVAFTPSGVTLQITAVRAGVPSTVEYAMTANGGDFIYALITSDIDLGAVTWRAESDDAPTRAIAIGDFRLYA